MATFGEGTARPLPEEDQSGVRSIRRKKSFPKPAKLVLVNEEGKEIAKPAKEATLIPDEEVHGAFPKAKKRKFYTPKGTEMATSTPETRARFEEERAEEREEMKRFMEKKEQERQEVLKRLEELEQRILETGEAADRAKAERERIEAESREEQEAIRREAMEGVEARAAARGKRMESMKEDARLMGRREGEEVLAKELEGFESQLRMDERGHVSGMKNVPYLNAHAVLLALPAMWKKHDMERAWLTKNKPPGWERFLKDLDVNAERMSQMREKADELMDAGHRDARVRNFFYRYEGQPVVEGADQVAVETLLASPEKVLDDRERLLREEGEAVDRAVEEAEDLSQQIDDFLEEKQEEIDYAEELVEFDDALIKDVKLRLEELNARHDLNHMMQQPERLDVYGNRLQAAYERAKGMIDTRKRELSTVRGDAEQRKEILVMIGEEEFSASEAQKQLAVWKEDPTRARVMGYRLEALQDEAAALSKQISESERMLREVEEEKIQFEGKPEMIVREVDDKNLSELIDLTDDKMQYLLREKMRIARQLADVRRVRVMQEAPPQGEEVEVDFSEEEPRDEEELDIDVDDSDFTKEDAKKKAA